jgi:hypothetical protein
VGATLAILAIAVLTLAISWARAGPISTIAYALLFVLGATLVPLVVTMFGKATPTPLGDGLWILGQLAFDEGWLVQHDDGWEMHPGRCVDGHHQVHLHGAWHDVDVEHQTVLGWRRFGILLDKTDRPFGDVTVEPSESDSVERIDSAPGLDEETATALDRLSGDGTDGVLSDGGEDAHAVRGGVRALDPPEDVPDDCQVVDLGEWWTRGLSRLGDTEVLEQIEEVTMRKEAGEDGSQSRRTVLGSLVGLVLGVATGFVLMGGL